MRAQQQKAARGQFERVGECLYRYSSNGVYYALLKHQGKQKRTSLGTTDKALAKRKLADMKATVGKVDFSNGRLTLAELCATFLATIRGQKAKTVRRKTDIVARLLKDFPEGRECQVSKVRKSSLESWLASYNFGYASHNLYSQCVKAIFQLAVDDRVLAESPAEGLKSKKIVRPRRQTPSFEEFVRIVANVRSEANNADAEESANFLEFMGLAGLGQAELAHLKVGDIDADKARIQLIRVKTSTPFFIPLYPQLEPVIRRLSLGLKKRDDSVFAIKDCKKALAGACRRLGLPAYSQRSLRRMFITRCIERGIDVKVIADWQGHQDGGKLILATYSHVRKTHADEMAKRLKLSDN